MRRLRTFMGLAILLGAGLLASAATLAVGAPHQLLRIGSRADARSASLFIEASEPVPYVTRRPDPLTVLVELETVGAGSLALPDDYPRPVAGVDVEETTAAGGEALVRVRIRLDEPAAHRVKSDGSVVQIEFERSAGRPIAVPQPPPPVEIVTPSAGTSDGAALGDAVPPAPALVVLDASGLPAGSDLASPAAAAATAAAGQPPMRQAPAPPPVSVVQPPERQFTGHPISLDFQGVDLRAVLRTFAEISGLNIVIDPAVQGSVDVALRDVPWDQALDIILRANKLGYSVDGTIVRIAPLVVLADEEAQRRKLAEEQALSGELRVLTRTLSYARAATLRPLITRAALSQRGSVEVDERTNTLIIRDLQERLTSAEALLTTLDRPEPQVEIEARIITTTRDFARAIGVQWGLAGRASGDIGNTTGLAFPNRGGVTGRTGSVQGPFVGQPGPDPRATIIEQQGSVVNLPATNATSAIGIALGSINGALNLDIALSALERTGKGRILSTPRVSTQNNVEAEVMQGIQIPIQTVANNTVTVSFKDAALSLRVTPQITSAATVIMRIVLENASPDFSRQVNGIPPIDTQRANTQVLVNDGATTVIGGILVSREQTVNDRTPGLHRLPLLGWLFKRDSQQDESRELLIFITPRIAKS